MKKLYALFLAAIFLLLAGCENVQYEISDPFADASSKDIYEELNSQLPSPETEITETRSFTIATSDKKAFYQDESMAGTISTAIENRNAFLKEKYGANIVVKEYTDTEFTKAMKTAVLTNESICDMISMSAQETVKLYVAGFLADMNSLSGFDLENGCFDKKLSQSLATNQSLYLLADPTALVYDDVFVMFYNDKICPIPEGGKDIETLVMQGEWTWDKFGEYQKLAAAEVYKQGGGVTSKDIFGFGAYHETTTYPLVQWTSCGRKLVDNTYKNPVGISMDSEEIIEIAQFLKKKYNAIGRFPLEGEEAREAFENDRLAFFCNKLSYLYALRDGTNKGDDFKFVPIPKYNEEQSDYACLVSNEARVISVPISIENKDASYQKYVSNTISGICAIGNKTIKTAYINSLLAVYLNTNEETVMMNMICDSATFDFATVYGSEISQIATPTIKAVANYLDYGSGISSSLNRGKEAFEKYCNEHFNPQPQESESSQE